MSTQKHRRIGVWIRRRAKDDVRSHAGYIMKTCVSVLRHLMADFFLVDKI